MVPSPFSGQVARGLGRFTQLFKNQPNCRAILSSLLVGFPELNATVWQVINTRMISTLTTMVAAGQNTGNQIDLVGALVGEDRGGRSDADFLNIVKVRIRVNRSQGRAEDVMQVSDLLNPSTYSEYPIMSWLVESWNLPSILNAATFARLLRETKAVGSRGTLNYSNWAPNLNLIADSVHGGVTITRYGDSVRGGVAAPGLGVASQGV